LKVEAAKMPGPLDYTILTVGGKQVAGIFAIPKEIGPVPPNWMVYFAVADVDASVKKAQSLGAKVLANPMDIPGVGRFATLQDPQGAVFSVFKGAPAS
jgi:predicted enzyme related to lactoylglutathione lyase